MTLNVMERNWDYLIVLDACRYDYFAKVYKDYFEGELEKINSVGVATPEWCVNTFQEKYEDVVYISANPHINSVTSIWDGKWAAKDHFHKVIDVWKWGWDDDLRTVHPREVNSAFIANKGKYPGKRFIIHYMQPHAPYLAYQPLVQFRQPIVDRNTEKPLPFSVKIARKALFLGKRANLHLARTFGIHIRKFLWQIHELLGFQPVNRIDAVRREIGDLGLRKVYEKNLRIVLRYVTNLLSDLSGKIFITSDHGEYLGELGDYGHLSKLYDPILLEVPWFRIREVKTTGVWKRKVKRKIQEMKHIL